MQKSLRNTVSLTTSFTSSPSSTSLTLSDSLVQPGGSVWLRIKTRPVSAAGEGCGTVRKFLNKNQTSVFFYVFVEEGSWKWFFELWVEIFIRQPNI